MAISWRVRRWKLNGTVTADKSITSAGPSTSTITGSGTLRETNIYALKESSPAAACTREADLVGRALSAPFVALANGGIGTVDGAAPISDWSTMANFGTLNHSGSTPASGTPALEMLLHNGYVLYDPSTQMFSPSFSGFGESFGGSIGNGLIPFSSGGNQLGVIANFTRSPQTISGGTTPIVLRKPINMTVIPHICDSFNVPMELGWRFQSEGIGDSASGSGSGGFTLEAVEFWSYDGTWDTSGGGQLLDPFR